jgi:competence protein ComEA
MSHPQDWAQGPARFAAAAVLGAAGLTGIGYGLLADRPSARIEPPPALVAIEHTPPETKAPRPEPESSAAPATPPASTVAVRIDINRADEATLDLLPGIGPVMARRIADDRAANGPFASLTDLQRVKGIGPRTAEKLEDYVRFD